MSSLRLKSVQFIQLLGKPKEWSLEGLKLWPSNLIVGRNATGKTRIVNLIWNFARSFFAGGRIDGGDCDYQLLFDHDGSDYRYILQADDGNVVREEVWLDGDTQKLFRGEHGEGQIWMETERRMIPFRPPENELAAVARRDSLQHPFLEPLHDWANGVRFFPFSGYLGKWHLFPKLGPEPDERDANQVVGIFNKGRRELGESYIDAIVRDMKQMGYDLEEIDTLVLDNQAYLQGRYSAEVLALGVREKGINGVVNQTEMAQGMFRALSVLIQVNYSQMKHRASLMLIDDIGEGLDFERSARLVELLRERVRGSNVQLVMTTNDQFVMNHVPLDEWSVLVRDGNHVRVLNHENSKESFEEFKFMGLNNFSFFEMDLAESAPEEALTHE